MSTPFKNTWTKFPRYQCGLQNKYKGVGGLYIYFHLQIMKSSFKQGCMTWP